MATDMVGPIIDAVTHIATGPDNVVGWGPRFLAEDLLAQMDSPRVVLGEQAIIERAVVFPALGLTVPTSTLSFEEQHQYVRASVHKYSDRLIGGVVVHPRLWSNAVAGQIESMVKNEQFRMIYIHPSLHKFWLPIQTPSEGEGSKRMLYPLFRLACQLGVPVYIHTGEQPYAMPATADFVAEEFPEARIIIGHLGTQGEMLSIEALLVASRHKNVFVETSYAMPHMIIEAVHTIGAERVVFGSNCPPMEPTQQLMNVEQALSMDPPIGAGLSADGVMKVLGGNLARLMGLEV